jgi:hypothetical protein
LKKSAKKKVFAPLVKVMKDVLFCTASQELKRTTKLILLSLVVDFTKQFLAITPTSCRKNSKEKIISTIPMFGSIPLPKI